MSETLYTKDTYKYVTTVVDSDLSLSSDSTVRKYQMIYIAYLGKPIDNEAKTAFKISNTQPDRVATTVYTSQSYKAIVENMNNTQIIQRFYSNLFNRQATTQEIVYWDNQITNGTLINQIGYELGTIKLESAADLDADDKHVLINRIKSAESFRTALGLSPDPAGDYSSIVNNTNFNFFSGITKEKYKTVEKVALDYAPNSQVMGGSSTVDTGEGSSTNSQVLGGSSTTEDIGGGEGSSTVVIGGDGGSSTVDLSGSSTKLKENLKDALICIGATEAKSESLVNDFFATPDKAAKAIDAFGPIFLADFFINGNYGNGVDMDNFTTNVSNYQDRFESFISNKESKLRNNILKPAFCTLNNDGFCKEDSSDRRDDIITGLFGNTTTNPFKKNVLRFFALYTNNQIIDLINSFLTVYENVYGTDYSEKISDLGSFIYHLTNEADVKQIDEVINGFDTNNDFATFVLHASSLGRMENNPSLGRSEYPARFISQVGVTSGLNFIKNFTSIVDAGTFIYHIYPIVLTSTLIEDVNFFSFINLVGIERAAIFIKNTGPTLAVNFLQNSIIINRVKTATITTITNIANFIKDLNLTNSNFNFLNFDNNISFINMFSNRRSSRSAASEFFEILPINQMSSLINNSITFLNGLNANTKAGAGTIVGKFIKYFFDKPTTPVSHATLFAHLTNFIEIVDTDYSPTTESKAAKFFDEFSNNNYYQKLIDDIGEIKVANFIKEIEINDAVNFFDNSNVDVTGFLTRNDSGTKAGNIVKAIGVNTTHEFINELGSNDRVYTNTLSSTNLETLLASLKDANPRRSFNLLNVFIDEATTNVIPYISNTVILPLLSTEFINFVNTLGGSKAGKFIKIVNPADHIYLEPFFKFANSIEFILQVDDVEKAANIVKTLGINQNQSQNSIDAITFLTPNGTFPGGANFIEEVENPIDFINGLGIDDTITFLSYTGAIDFIKNKGVDDALNFITDSSVGLSNAIKILSNINIENITIANMLILTNGLSIDDTITLLRYTGAIDFLNEFNNNDGMFDLVNNVGAQKFGEFLEYVDFTEAITFINTISIARSKIVLSTAKDNNVNIFIKSVGGTTAASYIKTMANKIALSEYTSTNEAYITTTEFINKFQSIKKIKDNKLYTQKSDAIKNLVDTIVNIFKPADDSQFPTTEQTEQALIRLAYKIRPDGGANATDLDIFIAIAENVAEIEANSRHLTFSQDSFLLRFYFELYSSTKFRIFLDRIGLFRTSRRTKFINFLNVAGGRLTEKYIKQLDPVFSNRRWTSGFFPALITGTFNEAGTIAGEFVKTFAELGRQRLKEANSNYTEDELDNDREELSLVTGFLDPWDEGFYSFERETHKVTTFFKLITITTLKNIYEQHPDYFYEYDYSAFSDDQQTDQIKYLNSFVRTVGEEAAANFILTLGKNNDKYRAIEYIQNTILKTWVNTADSDTPIYTSDSEPIFQAKQEVSARAFYWIDKDTGDEVPVIGFWPTPYEQTPANENPDSAKYEIKQSTDFDDVLEWKRVESNGETTIISSNVQPTYENVPITDFHIDLIKTCGKSAAELIKSYNFDLSSFFSVDGTKLGKFLKEVGVTKFLALRTKITDTKLFEVIDTLDAVTISNYINNVSIDDVATFFNSIANFTTLKTMIDNILALDKSSQGIVKISNTKTYIISDSSSLSARRAEATASGLTNIPDAFLLNLIALINNGFINSNSYIITKHYC